MSLAMIQHAVPELFIKWRQVLETRALQVGRYMLSADAVSETA